MWKRKQHEIKRAIDRKLDNLNLKSMILKEKEGHLEDVKQKRMEQEEFRQVLLEEEIRKKVKRMDIFCDIQNRKQIPFGITVIFLS